MSVLNQQMARGDFFLCASAKQRDFWLGQLAGLGRLNPLTYGARRDPRQADQRRAVRHRRRAAGAHAPAIKGVVPGIEPDDKVIIWGGGIYNWFDPLSLIRAVDRCDTGDPTSGCSSWACSTRTLTCRRCRWSVQTQELSDQLGLTGTFVFFNEGWVPYDDRQNYLLDADVGVSTHFEHIETTFSFRTRILDYLWAPLPIVTTRATRSATWSAASGSVSRCRRKTSTRSKTRCSGCSTTRSSPASAASMSPSSRRTTPGRTCWRRWPTSAAHRAGPLTCSTSSARRRSAAPRSYTEEYRPSMAANLDLAQRYFKQGGAGMVVRRGLGRLRRVSRERIAGRGGL